MLVWLLIHYDVGNMNDQRTYFMYQYKVLNIVRNRSFEVMIMASWSTASLAPSMASRSWSMLVSTNLFWLVSLKTSTPSLINCKFFECNLVTGPWVHKMNSKRIKRLHYFFLLFLISSHEGKVIVTILWFSDRAEIASFGRGDIGPYLLQYTLLLWAVLFHSILPKLKYMNRRTVPDTFFTCR